ncbi:MAG: hypothetical protein JWQ28_133 [Pedobacter sp.]|nr:hypothetical protein [Pedobacter sp.]
MRALSIAKLPGAETAVISGLPSMNCLLKFGVFQP